MAAQQGIQWKLLSILCLRWNNKALITAMLTCMAFHLLDNAVTTNIVKKMTTLFLALFCPNTILEDSAVPY